jgi:hypothetical protein
MMGSLVLGSRRSEITIPIEMNGSRTLTAAVQRHRLQKMEGIMVHLHPFPLFSNLKLSRTPFLAISATNAVAADRIAVQI